MMPPRLLAGPLPGGDPVFDQSIAALQASLLAGRLSAVDLARAYLARIAAHDQHGPSLNAVLALNPNAQAEAADRDAQRQRGQRLGPLHGIPILFKDNIDVVGMPATAGCRALAQRRPRQDADVVRRLREAGAVVLGKATLHELACGMTNVSSQSGRTRNAYDAARVPGGSSGGSAVAVASSFAAAAIGSDTSGSIRVPAAFNQVWALRPTVGRCRTDGVVPLSPTLDTVGPMTRSLDDLTLLWSVMADPDGGGATLPASSDVWHIGRLDELFGDAPEEREVSAFARAALERWRVAGAHLSVATVRVDDARLQAANVTGYEFRDALARCLRDDGLAVRSLTDILDGGYPHPEAMPILQERDALRDADGSLRAAVLGRAQAIRADVLAALAVGSLDVLVYPSVRRAPVLLGEPQRGANGLLAAVTGLPALSVPIGFTPTGIPVGLDLLGSPGSESRLLAAARRLEAVLRAD